MSSTIDVTVLGEGGEHLSHMRFTVDYGNEEQLVTIVLDGDSDASDEVGKSFLDRDEMLIGSMGEASREGYDA